MHVDKNVKEEVCNHIRSISRIESHYLRAQTREDYKDGGKSITVLHMGYQLLFLNEERPSVNEHMYSDIFNQELGFSCLVPKKKNQCNLGYLYHYPNNEENGKIDTPGT